MDTDLFNKKVREANELIRSDVDKAITIYQEIITEIISMNQNKRIVSFYNPIEYILYIQLYGKEEIANLDVPFHLIYLFLGNALRINHDFEPAILAYENALKVNPFFFDAAAEKATSLLKIKDYENMHKCLMDNYKFIYNQDDLLTFYSLLGEYYFATGYLTEANHIYSYVETFKTDANASKKLDLIAKELNREVKRDSIEEIKTFFNENNIPLTIELDIYNRLIGIFNKEANTPVAKKIKGEVKKILYKLTNDDIYAPSLVITNKEHNFSFNIPDSWRVVSRNEYPHLIGEVILYIIKPNNIDAVTISTLGKVNGSVKKQYSDIRSKLLYNGSLIVNETSVTINGNEFIQSYVAKKILNDSIIEVHNYIDINGDLIDFKINVDSDSVDLHKLYNNKNVIKLNIILSSIKIIGKEETKKEEFLFF